MPVESPFEYPSDLNEAYPQSTDTRREGDDHLRGIKRVIRNVTANCSGTPVDGALIDKIFPPNGGSVFVLRNGGVPVSPATFLGGTWVQGSNITLADGTTVLDLWTRDEP